MEFTLSSSYLCLKEYTSFVKLTCKISCKNSFDLWPLKNNILVISKLLTPIFLLSYLGHC